MTNKITHTQYATPTSYLNGTLLNSPLMLIPGNLYKTKRTLTAIVDEEIYVHYIPRNSVVLCVENIMDIFKEHYNSDTNIRQRHHIKLLSQTNKICQLQYSFNLSLCVGTPSFHDWYEPI